ncbi:hypothetical protein Leryth_001691 [Lithospermum erythrorhizon]|nr:hypothetical protein Leryth_001691 [Lithospermum erythrorhizon]
MEVTNKTILILGLIFLLGDKGVKANGGSVAKKCKFSAIFNFGDSNSDTGGGSAALREIPPPNGITFFGVPSGRACDGRLLIDFIAERLGLPYVSAYLDSFNTNFRTGANFAIGGSSIVPPGYSPFPLDIQISQFVQFKSHTIALFKKLNGSRSVQAFKNNLPRPEDFGNALYTFDIGQNDLSYGFQHGSETQVKKSIPSILDKFSQAIHTLYAQGARRFWVHNTGPVGCLPYSYIYYPYKQQNLDNSGCVKPQNEVAREFNRQLKNRIFKLRTQLRGASLSYVDVYSAKYGLISRAKNIGYGDPMMFCCGSYYGYHIDCGKRAVVNGTVYGNPCRDPSKFISWDGIHYSERANRMVAAAILNGTLTDPPVSIEGVC